MNKAYQFRVYPHSEQHTLLAKIFGCVRPVYNHWQKGSKNREKQRIKFAILYEKIANQRKDFLHKQSRQITNLSIQEWIYLKCGTYHDRDINTYD